MQHSTCLVNRNLCFFCKFGGSFLIWRKLEKSRTFMIIPFVCVTVCCGKKRRAEQRKPREKKGGDSNVLTFFTRDNSSDPAFSTANSRSEKHPKKIVPNGHACGIRRVFPSLFVLGFSHLSAGPRLVSFRPLPRVSSSLTSPRLRSYDRTIEARTALSE